jgi:hypothetical protein
MISLKRLPKGSATQAQPPTPSRTRSRPPTPASPEPQFGPHTAVLFRSADRVLAFAGASETLPSRYRCNSSDHWWVEVDSPCTRVASMAVLAGGLPFTGEVDSRWYGVNAEGLLLPDRIARVEGDTLRLWVGGGTPVESTSGWVARDLQHLISRTQLAGAPVMAGQAVEVLALPSLGRLILHGALERGFEVEMALADSGPLEDGSNTRKQLWLRVRGLGQAPLTSSWIRSLIGLGDVLVARAIGTAGRLLVDVRARPPAVGGMLERAVPEGQTWVLGLADRGHSWIRATADFVDGAGFLAPESSLVRTVSRASEHSPAQLPAKLSVRVVRSSGLGRVDAVWVDDRELCWLRTYLLTTGLGESFAVLPGVGRHVVIDAADRAQALPFGIALTRVGPGALYLERGTGFRPALPDPARRQLFGDTDRELVVLTQAGNARYSLEQLVPAWTLWAGEPAPIHAAIDAPTWERLSRVVRTLAPQEAPPKIELERRKSAKVAEDRGELQRLAALAISRGRWIEAAELHERLENFALAARLYETAAGRRE